MIYASVFRHHGCHNHAVKNLLDDLRFGMRSLHTNRMFSGVVIITVTLGIGVNVAVFSIVNALLLRPYPFPHLDQLVLLRAAGPQVASPVRMAPADFIDLQRDSKSFERLSAFRGKESTLMSGGEAISVVTFSVSPGFFEMLGRAPILGRAFLTGVSQSDDNVAVLNYGFWKRRYAGHPGVIGDDIVIDGRALKVVGVMPADFNSPPAADVWQPLVPSPQDRLQRDPQMLTGPAFQVIGRLRSGVGLGEAESELQAFESYLEKQFPATHQNRSLHLLRLREEQYAFTTPVFLLLQFAAVLVLLLAGANLVNLFFARLIQRQKEMALRTALGASGGSLVRLYVGEILPMFLVAAVLALFAASFGVNFIRDGIPVGYTKWIAGWSTIQLDRSIIGVSLALTVFLGGAFALGAGWRCRPDHLGEILKEAGRSSPGPRGSRLRTVIVTTQVVIATVLLAEAALMIKGFYELSNIYRTFDPNGVAIARISLPQQLYPGDGEIRSFGRRVLQNLEALSGVEAAGIVTNLPASNVDNTRVQFVIDGQTILNPSEAPSADLQIASSGFFRSLRIPLLEGREISNSDGETAPRVAVISRTMARQFWPNSSAVGRRIRIGKLDPTEPSITVIGVVEDVKQNWWNSQKQPVIYLSYLQAPRRAMTVTVRGARDPEKLIASMRSAVFSLDPNVSLINARTMELEVSEALAPLRILGILLVLFGVIGLIVGAFGVYGILSYAVAQRMNEFGIRIALGAQRRDVIRLVVSQAFKITLVGVSIGFPLAYLLTRTLESVLYGIVTFDPMVFLSLAVLLSAVAHFAGYIPARRAVQVNPLTASTKI